MTDFTKLSDRDVAIELGQTRQQEQLVKLKRAALEAELSRREEAKAADLFRIAGKDTGSVSYSHSGMKFKAEVSKKVEWDSDKLKAIAATMPWPQVERLFDIKFAVPERTYNAIPDPELVAKLNSARTTKVGELKVSFVGFDVGNGDRE